MISHPTFFLTLPEIETISYEQFTLCMEFPL